MAPAPYPAAAYGQAGPGCGYATWLLGHLLLAFGWWGAIIFNLLK